MSCSRCGERREALADAGRAFGAGNYEVVRERVGFVARTAIEDVMDRIRGRDDERKDRPR